MTDGDIFDDAQYVHPLVAKLRDRADSLRRDSMPGVAAEMNRAANTIEELHRQNVVMRRTLGMKPIPPV
jgi:hypothetical protein